MKSLIKAMIIIGTLLVVGIGYVYANAYYDNLHIATTDAATPLEILLAICVWIALAAGVGLMAETRGQNKDAFAIAAVFVSAPIALLFLLATPVKNAQLSAPIASDVKRVACPRCAEMVMPGAAVCRFCGADLKATKGTVSHA